MIGAKAGRFCHTVGQTGTPRSSFEEPVRSLICGRSTDDGPGRKWTADVQMQTSSVPNATCKKRGARRAASIFPGRTSLRPARCGPSSLAGQRKPNSSSPGLWRYPLRHCTTNKKALALGELPCRMRGSDPLAGILRLWPILVVTIIKYGCQFAYMLCTTRQAAQYHVLP